MKRKLLLEVLKYDYQYILKKLLLELKKLNHR